jgi:hypothetical protein
MATHKLNKIACTYMTIFTSRTEVMRMYDKSIQRVKAEIDGTLIAEYLIFFTKIHDFGTDNGH